jgi:hypothetical protein
MSKLILYFLLPTNEIYTLLSKDIHSEPGLTFLINIFWPFSIILKRRLMLQILILNAFYSLILLITLK